MLPQDVASKVTYALSGVIRGGTGTAAALGRPAAGKTGTAENFEDAWFCGFVPQLAACVWVGYPQAEIPLENLDGFGAGGRRLDPRQDLARLHGAGTRRRARGTAAHAERRRAEGPPRAAGHDEPRQPFR